MKDLVWGCPSCVSPVSAAQLGYGDGDEATLVSYAGDSSNKIRTYYFRQEFSVADPGAYADLTLRVIRDDGAGSNAGLALDGDCTVTGQRALDLTPFVQEWSDWAANYGLVMNDGGTNGVDFGSSESGNPPVLTVAYQAGGVVVTETKAMSGTSDAVTFTRTLADGQTYEWNCEVTNLSGGRASAPASFGVSVDTQAVP